jgi:hypothetical protein
LFKERFRYRAGEDPDHYREVLEAITAKRYNEELHAAREKCINKYVFDKEEWKKEAPHWCLTPEHWVGLCD